MIKTSLLYFTVGTILFSWLCSPVYSRLEEYHDPVFQTTYKGMRALEQAKFGALSRKRNTLTPGARELNSTQYIENGQIKTRHFFLFTQGQGIQTGRPLDLMIDGTGFFALVHKEKEVYTRDGRFLINSQGYLVSRSGLYVLGESGPIVLDDNQVQITKQGHIYYKNELKGIIRVVHFKDNRELFSPNGVHFFNSNDKNYQYNDTPPYIIRQGYIESSNVGESRRSKYIGPNYEANALVLKMAAKSYRSGIGILK